MKAIDRFDWKKGYKFSTYAIWWIRQSIGQHLTKTKRLVRMPGHIVGLCKRMRRALETDDNMTLDELSIAVGASKRLVKAAAEASGPVVSLYSEINRTTGDAEGRFIDTIEDKSSPNAAGCLAEKQLVAIVRRVLEEKLSEKESMVLRLRYGLVEDPNDPESYPLTQENLTGVKDEETQSEADVLDGGGMRWNGVQADHPGGEAFRLEDELQQRAELANESHAKDGS
jgi:RNA polymerase sigma factor (sigma-70 family)